MDLTGKVAIVTGAGSGIGYATAERLGAAGASICVNYLDHEEAACALAARLPRAIAVHADVSRREQVQAMVDRVCRELGSIGVLVNNAAIVRESPFLDMGEEDWDASIDVNLKGVVLCSQACGRVMRDAGQGGSIVNISSIHEDLPFPGFTPYAAAKGGMRMVMRNLAVELAQYRIRVNNVAPGAIATPLNAATMANPAKMRILNQIIPLSRMGSPEEVAQVVLFLASEDSSYVTGSTYYVDGGMLQYSQPV